MADGRRAHRHSAPRRGSSPLLTLVGLGAGVVVSALAWVYLVSAALDFAGLAVRGHMMAWLFTLGAVAGALVCLGLVLGLVGLGLRGLGYLSDYKPRRAGTRRSH